MSNNDHFLSEDEIHFRIASPEFFKELIDSRTATLIEEGNPEALTAWKETREHKDRLFAELAPQVKLDVEERGYSISLERQIVEFVAAFNRLAAEYELPIEKLNTDSKQAADAYAKLLHERFFAEDMRFTVAREIDASKQGHHQATEPKSNSFGKESQATRSSYLAEQVKIGGKAQEAQELSRFDAPSQKFDSPEQENE